MIDLKELPRTETGVRKDVESKRDLSFSKWHRNEKGDADKPERWCYLTDMDFLEYRFVNNNLVLRALIEAKKGYVMQSKYVEDNAGFKAIKQLAQKAGILFFHVWYFKDDYDNEDEEIKEFLVWDTSKLKDTAIKMKPIKMKQFIESL